MALNLSRLRFENPVLTKELRTRMRGARAYWILFVYLLLLSLILFFTYMTWWQSQRGDDMGAGQAAFSVGKMFYLVVLCTQSVLVGLITPALTAGSISIEREQRTYEMLSASLLPRRSIVAGKLWAASAFVGLLLTASLPLVSLCFLLGGVSPGEVFASYGLLLTVAFVYGGVGVAWSAIARKTATATVGQLRHHLFAVRADLSACRRHVRPAVWRAGLWRRAGRAEPGRGRLWRHARRTLFWLFAARVAARAARQRPARRDTDGGRHAPTRISGKLTDPARCAF
jgi:hypothetical protein